MANLLNWLEPSLYKRRKNQDGGPTLLTTLRSPQSSVQNISRSTQNVNQNVGNRFNGMSNSFQQQNDQEAQRRQQEEQQRQQRLEQMRQQQEQQRQQEAAKRLQQQQAQKQQQDSLLKSSLGGGSLLSNLRDNKLNISNNNVNNNNRFTNKLQGNITATKPADIGQKTEAPTQNINENSWKRFYNEEQKAVREDAFKNDGFGSWLQDVFNPGWDRRLAENRARTRNTNELINRAWDNNGKVINPEAASMAKKAANEGMQVSNQFNEQERANSRAIGASADSDYKNNRFLATFNAIRNMDVGNAIFNDKDPDKLDASDAGRFVTNLLPGLFSAPINGVVNLSEAAAGKGLDRETGNMRQLDGTERLGRALSGGIDMAGVFYGGSGELLNSIGKSIFNKGASEITKQAVKNTSKEAIKGYLNAMMKEGAEEGVQQAFEFFGDGGKLVTKDGEFDADSFKQMLQESGQAAGLGALGGGIFHAGSNAINAANNFRTGNKSGTDVTTPNLNNNLIGTSRTEATPEMTETTTGNNGITPERVQTTNDGTMVKTNTDGTTSKLTDDELANVIEQTEQPTTTGVNPFQNNSFKLGSEDLNTLARRAEQGDTYAQQRIAELTNQNQEENTDWRGQNVQEVINPEENNNPIAQETQDQANLAQQQQLGQAEAQNTPQNYGHVGMALDSRTFDELTPTEQAAWLEQNSEQIPFETELAQALRQMNIDPTGMSRLDMLREYTKAMNNTAPQVTPANEIGNMPERLPSERDIAQSQEQPAGSILQNLAQEPNIPVNTETTGANEGATEASTRIPTVEELSVARPENTGLVETANQYGVQINANELSNIQNMLDKQGIQARYDKNTFNNSNENAMWRTRTDSNGNTVREVIINPKANNDTVIQELAVHELAHDIFAKDTETSGQLYQGVKDWLEKDPEYQNKLSDLKKAYGDDVNVEEEAIAKTLQSKLGNQEEINRLVEYNPSLARKVYDWVVEKLNNVTGGRVEGLYWRDIKNKFEKAYSENGNTTTDSTKLSVTPTTDSEGNTLSKQQQEYFKDSVVRDENGDLTPMYHGTRGNFTVFGDKNPNSSSNSKSSVGYWFTPTEEGAKNFAESIWYGEGKPKAMKTYLNIKNPKVYESVDNSKAVDLLRKKLSKLELKSKSQSMPKLYYKSMYDYSVVQNMVNQGDKYTAIKWLADKSSYDNKTATELVDEVDGLKELANKKKKIQDEIAELKYSDAYEKFRTDIYKIDGQNAENANIGGTGMVLNDDSSVQKYVDKLKSEGYDGIIIKGTNYDADTMGGRNDQYVVFDPNQIKNINNTEPTTNPDIRYSKESDFDEYIDNRTGKTTNQAEDEKNKAMLQQLDELWGGEPTKMITNEPKYNEAESAQKAEDVLEGRTSFGDYIKDQRELLWKSFKESNRGVERGLKADPVTEQIEGRWAMSNNGTLYRDLFKEAGNKQPTKAEFNEALNDVLENGANSRYYDGFRELNHSGDRALFGFNQGNEDIESILDLQDVAVTNQIANEPTFKKISEDKNSVFNSDVAKELGIRITDNDLDLYRRALNGETLTRQDIQNSPIAKKFEDYAEAHRDEVVINNEQEKGKATIDNATMDRLQNVASEFMANDESLKTAKNEGKAAIVLGMPASGKSSNAVDILADQGYFVLDNDNVKKIFPEYNNGLGAGNVHSASSYVATNIVLPEVTKNKTNVVIPVIGKTLTSLENYATILKEAGYGNIDLVNVALPIDKTATRNFTRLLETSRNVPMDYIYDVVGDNPTKNYNVIKERINNGTEPNFTSYSTLSTDVPRGTKARVIEDSKGIWLLPTDDTGYTNRTGANQGYSDGISQGEKNNGRLGQNGNDGLLNQNQPTQNIEKTNKAGKEEKLPENFDVRDYVSDQVKQQRERSKLPLKDRIKTTRDNLRHYLVDDAVAYESYIKDKNERLNIREGVDRVRSSDLIAKQWINDHGLKDAVGHLDEKEYNEFSQYLIAKRALEVSKQGKKTGRSKAADEALIKSVGDKYKKEEAAIRKYTRDMLEYSADNGLISNKLKDDLLKNNPDYVPMNRVFDVMEQKTGFKSKQLGNLSKQTVVQKMEGSTRTVEDPIESMMSNTLRMINEVERNKTAKLIHDSEYFHEKTLKDDEKPRSGYDRLSYMVDGKKVSYEVPELVAKEMKNLNSVLPDSMENFLKIAGAPTKLLRAGATQNNPIFALSNIIRDQLQATVTGSLKANAKGTPKAFSAAFGVGKKARALREELNRAGIVGNEYRQTYGYKPGQLVEQLKADGQMIKGVNERIKHPVNSLADLIGRTEYFTRAQQYFGTEGDATTKAQAARNNTLNFSRAGATTRILNRVIPFLNAGVQGGRITVNSFKNRPVHTSLALASLTGLALAAKGAAEAQDKELWDRIDNSDKESNLILFGPDAHYDPESNRVEGIVKIPMPQMLYPMMNAANNTDGSPESLINLAGDIFQATTGLNTPEVEKNGNVNGLPVVSQLTPTAIKPLLEAAVNKNTYTGSDLVSEYDSNKNPEDKGSSYTSGAARAIAKATGIDAPIIDNFISSWGGGLAKDLSKTMTDNPDNTKDAGGLGGMFGGGLERRFLSGTAESQYEIAEGFAANYKKQLSQNDEFNSLSKEDQIKVKNAIDNDMKAIAGIAAKTEQGKEVNSKMTQRQTMLSQNGFDAKAYMDSVLNKQAYQSSGEGNIKALSGDMTTYGNSGVNKSSITAANSLSDDSKSIIDKYNSMSSEEWDKFINGSSAESAAAEYKLAKAKYENDVANGKVNDAQKVKREKELAKLEVSQKWSKKYRDAYGLAGSKADMQAYLNGLDDKTRSETVAILNGLNNAMYETGIIKSSTYKTRGNAINNTTSKRSSGKRRKSGSRSGKSGKSGKSGSSGMTSAEASALASLAKTLSNSDGNTKVSTTKAPETKRKMARTRSSGNSTRLATYTPTASKAKITKGVKRSIT